MGLHQNRCWSEEAIRYVKGIMPYASANRSADLMHNESIGMPFVQKDLDKLRKKVEKRLPKELRNPKHGTRLFHDALMARSELIMTVGGGMGNCGEQSAMAYRYLVASGVKGVAFCDLVGGNHSFVLVGVSEPQRCSIPTLNPSVPCSVYGSKVVWCDPWYGASFSIADPLEWKQATLAILSKTKPNKRGTLVPFASSVKIEVLACHQ